MPEVNGNDPAIRASDYINLIPCAKPDVDDPNFAHAYEAVWWVGGVRDRSLGWTTLGEARKSLDDYPYAIRFGSHSLCPPRAAEIDEQFRAWDLEHGYIDPSDQ